jgi:hypothetical protein
MRNFTLIAAPVAVAIGLAGQLLAGGFYLQLGNPEANPEARKANAVLTVKATGCGEPAKARITATAISVVDGKRQEIPLKLVALSEPGTYALSQQWPSEGRWVIHLRGYERIEGTPAFTNALISAGPGGIDRYHAKFDREQFTPAAIEAMLK